MSKPAMNDLICDADGIRLPPDIVLAEWRGAVIVPHHAHDIFRRLAPEFGVDLDWARLNFAVGRAARFLTEGRLAAARKAVETVRLPQPLAKFNPNHYGPGPRGGQFAPADGSDAGVVASSSTKPLQIAQDERDRADENDATDPMASVRQALWNSSIRALREVDPNNAALTYFANPNSPPSQEALDRLNEALKQAVFRRVSSRIVPNGIPIGDAGSDPGIREASGGLEGAKELFDYLSAGAIIQRPKTGTTVADLPGGGYVTFRPSSDSGSPAVDINISGIPIRRIHFP